MEEPEKKKKNSGRLIYRIVLIVLLSIFVGTSLYTLNSRRVLHDPMPMPFGIGSAVVLSGSMEPTLSVNDLVLVRAQESYLLGDVVVYRSGGSLVIHRIVELGEDYVVTKGDANDTEDAAVGYDAIKGRMILKIPFAGVLVHALQSVPGALLVIALAVFLMERSWRKERAEDDRELDAIKAEIRKLKQQSEDKAESAPKEEAQAAPEDRKA